MTIQESQVDSPEADGFEFLDPDDFKGNKISELARIEWVRDHIDVDVQKADCPDPGTWSLLQYSRANKKEFYTKTMPKLFPNQKQIEAEREYADAGSRLDGVIDKLLEHARDAQMQGSTVMDVPLSTPRVVSNTPVPVTPEFADYDDNG